MQRILRKGLLYLAVIMLGVQALFPGQLVFAAAAPGVPQVPLHAPVEALRLRVESARQWVPSGILTHTAVLHYRWLVVQDDTGDPTHYGTNLGATDTNNSDYACKPPSVGGDPAYPANCQWPAIHSVKGGTSAVGGDAGAQDSEIVAQGDETAFAPDANGNPTLSIDTTSWAHNDHNPNRSYMISVLAGGQDVPNCTPSPTNTCYVDGYKLGGEWFKLPLNDSAANVTVALQPYPLPLVTVRMAVWNDLQTNGAYDTGEPNLAGFEGHISDVLDIVTTDWFGNPLCTVYQHDANGIMLLDADGRPLIQTIGGHCLSDANGVITIPYLGPDRYSATVIPPNGQNWYQTSTLEGWHDWDVWSIEGWNGYDPEFVQGAEPFPFAEFGFVQLQGCKHPAANPSPGQTTFCPGPNDPTVPLTGRLSDTGSISGTVVGTGEFSPMVGGLTIAGGQGKTIIENINQPLVSLIDTGNNDLTVWVGRGDANGNFKINHVPDGDYVLSYWDEDQAYLLTEVNVSVAGGEAIDMGLLDVAAWHSRASGKVCFDTNRNGKCDPGEQGIPGLTLNLLGRDNSLQFYGDNAAITDSNGNYSFPRTYPLGQWVVEQGYWEQYYTVGVTFQTTAQPTATTVIANGGFVDVSTFNLIGMVTHMDWAVHTYETDPSLIAQGLPANGGIVGEVVYDSTRNELDARFSGNESYQPGISGVPVHLYAPVKCNLTDAPISGTVCTPTTTAFGSANYLTISDTTSANNGAYVKMSDGSGNPIDLNPPYTSETWKRPTDCVARGADGNPVQEQVLPPSTGGHDCLEAPLMSSQVGDNSVGDFMQVDGNYGFVDACFDAAGNPGGYDVGATEADPTGALHCPTGFTDQGLKPADYIVEAISPLALGGKPALEPTMEEDINIADGDSFVPPGESDYTLPLPNRTPPANIVPAIPPFPCSGPMHTVHVVTDTVDAHFDPLSPATTQGVYNPNFVDIGGSPFEGQQKPLCDSRLVTVRNGRSATPNFFFHTQRGASTPVPLPGRIFGIVVDDLNLSTNPKELFYGEKYGIPNMPIGIYDFANRLVTTIETDPQGTYEVLLPSTSSYNCPLPAGPCPGIYRFLANDPGQPEHPNAGYNPAYQTIGGFFEVWPGVSLPSDLAPAPVAFGIENPGTQQAHPAQCLLNDPAQPTAPKVPELFAVNKPFVRSTDSGGARNIIIKGQDFGAAPGRITLTSAGGVVTTLIPAAAAWTDTQITLTVPATTGPGSIAAGPYQMKITGSDGQSTVNGLTLHVLSGNGSSGPQTPYNPTVYQVGPGLTGANTFDPNAASHNTGGYEHAIQDALNAAAIGGSNRLVVVYPGPTDTFNPLGAYFENVIIHSPVKLQGVGPGGFVTGTTFVPGSVLDGLGFGTDGARDTGWQATLAAIPTIIGPNNTPLDPATVAPPEGEVILSVATSVNQYGTNSSGYKAAIDGLLVQNGNVMDFVPNVNNLGNGTQVGEGTNTPTNPNQGGGIVALAATRFLQITNNILRSNGGAYAGAIRLGTPLVGDNHLDGVRIASNRILNNGGSNLAGAVGIFSGAYGYEVNNNDLCGNFSAEYGGGISHFGLTGNLQPTGIRNTNGNPSSIHDNRVYFNGSYDEGAGIIIAGEPPVNLNTFGAGAGPVNVYNNLIEGNLAGDDGGGLRFLTAGNFQYNVYNNMIVNNISSHEGGGVAIDNAPNVRFYNNTVMKNLTTATAATSNGLPAPAGLSTAPNNDFLQATLPAGSPTYSNPLLFNNIFYDNRAGSWDGANIVGIGGLIWSGGVQVPDPTAPNYWDMGVPGTINTLAPTNSVLQSETVNHGDVTASPTNRVDQDPLITTPYTTTVVGLPWRGNANFVANTLVAQDVPVTIMGNYHLSGAGSSAFNAGAASKAVPSYQQPPNSLAAPTFDIDNQGRPALGGFDSGADEFAGVQADLAITKDDGLTSVNAGATVHYTITVSNAGPGGASLAPVADSVPSTLTSVTWTCAAAGGSSCGAASGSGSINTTVTLPSGGSATFILNATVAANATGSLANTATVTAPAGVTDPAAGNNSATDTDTINAARPTLAVLDTFNRANANTLGANWNQLTVAGSAAIRTNTNQAFCSNVGGLLAPCVLGGQAIWNGAVYGAHQGAAFTIANTTVSGDALILKATVGGGSANFPANFIRVQYQGGNVIVATTTNAGVAYTTRGTIAAALVNGDTLTAVANADGSVDVWQNTTLLIHVAIPTSGAGAWTQGTGGGNIGMQMPNGARVDNFSGGTVP